MNASGTVPGTRLDGTRILVVEDEFYLAADLKETLELACGDVIGPCSHAEAALRELDRVVPDVAIVDINLGHGPSFETAEELQRRQIPFLFLTGHDAPTIPPELAHIERFSKPVEIERVLASVQRIAGPIGPR